VAYKFFPIRAVLQQDLIALKKKWSKREKKILDLVVARAFEERGMLTEPSSGVRIKCWQCVYILHFFEILLCKLCPLGLRS
jgi:hypothetical protein